MTLHIENTSPIASPVLRPVPGWTLWDVLLVAVVFTAALFFAAGIGLAVASYLPAFSGLDHQAIATNPLFFAPVQLVAYLAAFSFTRIYIELRSQGDFWEVIDWNLPDWQKSIAFLAVGVVLAFIVQAVGRFVPMPDDLPIVQYFRNREFVTLLATFAILVAPLAEEIFFRGLLYPAVRRQFDDAASLGAAGVMLWILSTVPFVWVYVRYGTVSKSGLWLLIAGAALIVVAGVSKAMPARAAKLSTAAAVGATALAFSLIHQGQLAGAWGPLLMLFFVGLVLTIVRVKWRSVAASWLVHTAYNTTLFVMMYLATDGFRNLDLMK